MSDDDKVPRLTTEGTGAPDQLRSLLQAARADVPSPAEMERLAALIPPLAESPPSPAQSEAGTGSAVSQASTAARGGTALAKAIGGAVLACAAVGAALLWYGTRGDVARTPDRPAPPAAAAHQPAKDVARAVPAPSEPERTASVPSREKEPRSIAPERAAGSPDRAPGQAAAPGGRTVPPTSAAPTDVQPREEVPAPEQVSEIDLLQRARRELGANPAAALALAQEHASVFPNGVLSEEREVIAIEALVRLHRIDTARTRVSRFFARYPGSAHRRRIEALLPAVD